MSVHYTDHSVPYGPFETSPGYCHIVLHTKPGAQVLMSDKRVRGKTNRTGRELVAHEKDVAWSPVPSHPGACHKVLINEASGVPVELLELPAGIEFWTGPSTYGRYELVLEGLAAVKGDETIQRHGLRFVIGDEPPRPLVAGPLGAHVLLCTFDKDAERTYIKEFAA